MTGQQIIDKFENLIADSLDPDFALQLVNDSKNSIESELQLEITKKLDSTDATTSGQTSTTAITLPPDFFLPLPIYVGTVQYQPVPFEHQQAFKDSPNKYWIDLGSDAYHLCGRQNAAETIYFFYQRETDDLTTATSPVWPSRFHSLIPYEMARKYFAIDQGEKFRSWMPEHQMFYSELKRQMIDWDAKLKLNAINNATPYGQDTEMGVPLSMM